MAVVQLAPFTKSPLRGSPLLRSYFCSFLGALLMHPRWLLFVRARNQPSWMHGCRSARAIHKIATPWLSAASQLLLLISWRSSHASTLAAFRASTKSALLDAWLNWCLKMYNDVVAHVYYGAFLGEGG